MYTVNWKEHRLPPTGNSLCRIVRLHRIRRRRVPTRLHGTKPASPGAGVAEQHDRGGGDPVAAAVPTLPNVGALSFLAHGVELEPRQRLLHLIVLLPLRRLLPQPPGLLHVRVPPRVGAHPARVRRRRLLLQFAADGGLGEGFGPERGVGRRRRLGNAVMDHCGEKLGENEVWFGGEWEWLIRKGGGGIEEGDDCFRLESPPRS